LTIWAAGGIGLGGGYEPTLLPARANEPVRLNLVTENMYSCTRAFVIPALGIQQILPATGTVTLDLPPQPPGTVLRFTCSMGMYRRPEQSSQGGYVIIDSYMRFYFRFLAPHLGEIEQGRVRQVTSLLYDHLLDFIGTHTFEELCRDWIGVYAEMGSLYFLPERIGSYWSKQNQVEVVAINWRTKDILLGECKWGQKPVRRK